jgi:signal transduction histidine kinase
MLTDFLAMQGYTAIRSTTDPREVISLYHSFSPDLILLDLVMPFISGFDVMQELQGQLPEGTFLPILVLTADITVDAKQHALSVGASDFLTKPFDLVEVGLRIKNLLFTRQLLRQLLDQNKLLEAFSYSISHELKTPLRHIEGFINILKEMEISRTSEELHYLQVISGGAREMGRIIEALLQFSRINRAELRKTRINSVQMVDHVINFFEAEWRDREVKFSVDRLHDCNGDEQLIKQVWTNLISNALKYTGKTDHAEIEIGSTANDKEVTFFIKDNGAGFSMEYSENLFRVFKRLHKATEFEGVGLGLANVNSIVTRHGGHCRAEGEPGKGAKFTFTLPN